MRPVHLGLCSGAAGFQASPTLAFDRFAIQFGHPAGLCIGQPERDILAQPGELQNLRLFVLLEEAQRLA